MKANVDPGVDPDAERDSVGDLFWQRFSVPYQYPVAFMRGLFRPDNPLFADIVCREQSDRRHRCFFVLDQGLQQAMPGLETTIATYFDTHRARLQLIAPPLSVPGGEAVKRDPAILERLYAAVHDHRIDRHSYVIAIGGGAVLDAVGLVAATAHRGVRHIRVPTTVLAQNDSGVGVKNAVNYKGFKNYLGTFAPPWAVLNDFDFLDHLPARERRAGLAEAIKVALIRDPAFFDWLEANAEALAAFRASAEEQMVRRCAQLHMHQIAHGGDPFEAGSARPLDFGHWSAHKLEGLSDHTLRHGEAVAIGIALDARYSVLAGLLEPGEEVRIATLLERLGFRLWHPALEVRDSDAELSILTGLQEFREHLGGDLTITLLRSCGQGIEVNRIDIDRMRAALAWLKART